LTSKVLAKGIRDGVKGISLKGISPQPLCVCICVYALVYIHTRTRECVREHTTHTHTHTHKHEKKYNEMRNILKIYKLHTKKDHVGSDEILDEFRV
jgi:hypothetical protein